MLGYHGCDREVGEAILAGENPINTSGNEFDWLGKGAYFWENDPDRAKSWALLIKQSPGHFRHRVRVKDPFVIGAIIDLGNCLDLTETGALELLKEAHSEMAMTFEESGVPLPKNEEGYQGDVDLVKRHLDCAVINFLHASREDRRVEGDGFLPFDTVRAAFWEGRPVFPGSRIMDKTHVQLCVRDPRKSIFGYFRPPGGK